MSTDVLTKPSLFDPLLSVNDVMEVLGASRTSVYVWLRGGKLRGVKLGDMTKVRRSELQRFMSELPSAPPADRRTTCSTIIWLPDRRATARTSAT